MSDLEGRRELPTTWKFLGQGAKCISPEALTDEKSEEALEALARCGPTG